MAAPRCPRLPPWRFGHSHRTTLPPQQCTNYQAQLSGQISLACSRRRGVSAQHKQATSRQRLQIPRDQVAQPPPDPVPNHGRPDGAAHDEADPRRLGGDISHEQVTDQQWAARPAALIDGSAELRPAPHPCGRGQHETSPPRARQRRSDADPRTALAAPGSEDCAAGAGAHAQPETVRLRAPAVIRLKRALAHGNSRYRWSGLRGGGATRATARDSRRHATLPPRRQPHLRQG